MSEVQVVEFEAVHAADFKRLNVEWITQHWELEEADRQALDHPKTYILDRGGAILMAEYEGAIVGSVALIPYDAETLELAKMAASPSVQGQGVGSALGEAAISRAKQMGARRVYLETNQILAPALGLYRKLGFTEISEGGAPSPYERCNVRMALRLKP